VPGLVALCNRCFQIGRRHFLKGNKAPIPDNAIPTTLLDNKADVDEGDTNANEAKRTRRSYSHTTAAATSEASSSDLPALSFQVSGKQPCRYLAGDNIACTSPMTHEESKASSIPSTIFKIKICIPEEADMSEDEEAAYAWAIESSMDDARRRSFLKVRQVEDTASTVNIRRIPGVGAFTKATRGPSLLGAAPGVCSSPAKAGYDYDSAGTIAKEQAGGRDTISDAHAECNVQMRIKRRKIINYDDIALDRLRIIKRAAPTGPYDDSTSESKQSLQNGRFDDLPADHLRMAVKRSRDATHDDGELDRQRVQKQQKSTVIELACCLCRCTQVCFYCWLKADGTEQPEIIGSAQDAPT
jgi:hypothetical protein